jgi:Fe-S-cluster containining protein
MHCGYPAAKDRVLVQITDAALADAARRSGKWLACKPGCSHCCVGVFSINQLDAMRLRKGLVEMDVTEPERAAGIRARVQETVAKLSADYPGDPVSGLLDEDNSPAASKRWDDFANDVPCPVLDPATGKCELYSSRPLLCRTFGPPVKSDESENDLTVCELCFEGATDEEVSSCEMHPDPDHLEDVILEELEKSTGASGDTIIAFALAR